MAPADSTNNPPYFPMRAWAPPQTVYIVRFGDRLKIGITGDVDLRLKMLEQQTKQKAQVLALLPVADTLSQRLHPLEKEREVLAMFYPWKVSGEWFAVSDASLALAARLAREQ